MSKSRSIESTKMKDNPFMNLVGIIIAAGAFILFLPLLPIIIIGYIFFKLKPSKK